MKSLIFDQRRRTECESISENDLAIVLKKGLKLHFLLIYIFKTVQ